MGPCARDGGRRHTRGDGTPASPAKEREVRGGPGEDEGPKDGARGPTDTRGLGAQPVGRGPGVLGYHRGFFHVLRVRAATRALRPPAPPPALRPLLDAQTPLHDEVRPRRDDKDARGATRRGPPTRRRTSTSGGARLPPTARPDRGPECRDGDVTCTSSPRRRTGGGGRRCRRTAGHTPPTGSRSRPLRRDDRGCTD